MISDFYLIVLTALAIYGLYSIVEEIILCLHLRNMAASLVIVDGTDETMACQSVDCIKNILVNTNVVILTEKQNIGVDVDLKTKDELIGYIANGLFTKN